MESRSKDQLRSTGMSRIGMDLSKGPSTSNSAAERSGDTAMVNRTRAAGTVPHVCVVGAGMAGLRCAEVLIKNGLKVTILEGRDRIGGRIHQSNKLGHLVDLGPNWIHGTEKNPIMELAEKTKTAVHTWNGSSIVYDGSGELMEQKKADFFSDVMWTVIGDAFKHSNSETASIPATESLYDFFLKKAAELFPIPPLETGSGATAEKQRKSQELLLKMAQSWGAFVGDPVTRQSLKFFWMEECCDGENLFVPGTYKAILDSVARSALSAADIHLSKRVIAVESQPQGRQALLTLDNGNSMSFDEIVLTTPLGWLKRNKAAFNPPLEPRLVKAIDDISYGHLEKVYVTFPKAFWEGEDSSSSSEDGPAEFTHWLSPEYAPDTNPNQWSQECLNFAAFAAPHAHPTLLFYLYGECAKYVTSFVNGATDSDQHFALNNFFIPYLSRLPHYSPSDPECQPSVYLATNWQNDEFAGYGSYCNFQVGLTDGDGDIEVMRHGMPERRIWLAGEHTAPFVAVGTVTGAYWSGEGAAQRIIETYGGKRRDEQTWGGVVVARALDVACPPTSNGAIANGMATNGSTLVINGPATIVRGCAMTNKGSPEHRIGSAL